MNGENDAVSRLTCLHISFILNEGFPLFYFIQFI